MFDISPDDISQLSDGSLRELVALLCEAELVSRSLSPISVTWGGDQNAADGGLDVRVVLPQEFIIDGLFCRAVTGFQVKKSDMPRSDIINEMRPHGIVRPVIRELADASGAYIIVSASGSTSDSALKKRQDALRDALDGLGNAHKLHTDFYDRTRLATWVRRHPGVIAWIKYKVGRASAGWRPYGSWSGSAENIAAEYLIDDEMKLHFGHEKKLSGCSVAQGIDEVRNVLSRPGNVIRLVGLSGVGKTRLAQALFDKRIGSSPLSSSVAIYTNLSDRPDPQPTTLVAELNSNQQLAVVIVDNCPAEMHQRLSELCSVLDSSVSILTIEYDVRDSQPEGTDVVVLGNSSAELIESLIARRYSYLSLVDAQTIAKVSGGNARIAIALAETVKRSDTIVGLSNDELFQRLFRQRHDPNDALLRSAQVCSLVYSFQMDDYEGESLELNILAQLANQDSADVYRNVAVLLRRDLVQRRGVWRAVLPQAIANRLAAWALDDIPYHVIDARLIRGGNERLLLSFVRRLSFMPGHPKAVMIAQRLIAVDGMLGELSALNKNQIAMFENIARIVPSQALSALARNKPNDLVVWQRHQYLIRSLAYDPSLFESCAILLAEVATQSGDVSEARKTSDIFVSLFTICFSGTHATIEQRIGVIEFLFSSVEESRRLLGLYALEKVLQTTGFGSFYGFEFGGWSRDYGYDPQDDAERAFWYSAAFKLIRRVILKDDELRLPLCHLLAKNFRNLWMSTYNHCEVEALFYMISADGFWREGWLACVQTMHLDREHMTADTLSKLSILKAGLEPKNIIERVKAFVLRDSLDGFDLVGDADDFIVDQHTGLNDLAYELGLSIATDDLAFTELLPDLLCGGSQVWAFGRGMAAGSSNPRRAWMKLANGLELIATVSRNVSVFNGFLHYLWGRDKAIADELLDTVSSYPALSIYLPVLSCSVQLDGRGVERLKKALKAEPLQIYLYRNLAYGGVTADLGDEEVKDLILQIADQMNGYDVALEILNAHLFSERSMQRSHGPKIIECCQELLRKICFLNVNDQVRERSLVSIARIGFGKPDSYALVKDITHSLMRAVISYQTRSFYNDDFFNLLLGYQPFAVLDALFAGEQVMDAASVLIFQGFDVHQGNFENSIATEDLMVWCESDGLRRYPIAASIVIFSCRSNVDESLVWSDHAKAILSRAVDLVAVLKIFADRFVPNRWAGSRADIIEENMSLLDSVELEFSGAHSFVVNLKEQLGLVVTKEREREARWAQEQGERFE